jgi:hypothetical protein
MPALRGCAGATPPHRLMPDAIDQSLKRGLHVTAEEADAWLERLENGDDREPPEPHH